MTLKTVCALIAIFLLLSKANAQDPKEFGSANECCQYWRYFLFEKRSKKGVEKVKPYQKDSIYLRNDEKSVICGIECLLRMQGNKRKTPCSANINLAYSTRLPNPTIEVAALYYISSIYGCAGNIAAIHLLDQHGNINSRESIAKAFQYYREWFEEVKRIGLSKAREEKLEPLKNRDVQWPYCDKNEMPPGYLSNPQATENSASMK